MEGEHQARAKLRQAWISRTNMDLDGCRQSLETLRAELEIASGSTYTEALTAAGQRLPLVADWILLQATLWRAEGRLADSRRLITEVDTHLRERAVPASFWLQ